VVRNGSADRPATSWVHGIDHRTFRLPTDLEEAIEAEYSNGILEVRLPVAGVHLQGREIEVQ